MKLKALLQDVEIKSVYTKNPEITNISDDSNKIRSSGVFVCLSGSRTDGTRYVEKARQMGAIIIISERELGCEGCIVVEDSRKAYAVMCSNFYGNSHRSMQMIGITGTNGKTTTSYLLKQILEDAGRRVGLIGTVSVVIGKERYPADLTTPNPTDLHRYFMMMKLAGCDTCVMEVSSQALAQKRTYGINFDCGVFTNLSPEHLDYHGTMEAYAAAKSILMSDSKISVINADDSYYNYMSKVSLGTVISYAVCNKADFKAKDIILNENGVEYTLKHRSEEFSVSFGSMGEFSVSNSMCAIAVANTCGVDINTATASVARFDGIVGRMENVPNLLGINIIIDYAHTPDSLANALKTLREVYSGKLITVFGCGGDRDKSKRPLMGKTACEYSDTVFVTSDNPRTEDPEHIIDEITHGLTKSSLFRITDRTAAIKAALYSASAGDTVLIAGKGHERYRIVGTQKIYYDEREIIRKILEDKVRF